MQTKPLTSKFVKGYNSKKSKCSDEESNRLRKAAASRGRCEPGAGRQAVKITSEQSGQKERGRFKYR